MRSGVDFNSPFTHLSAVPSAPGLLCDPMIPFSEATQNGNSPGFFPQAATLQHLQ
jgi:hypothetical protein